MRKIIMNLIRDILMELGLVITLLLMTLVVALNYDTHPILCSFAIIIGIITIILTFWNTNVMVLSFRIFILHIQIYKNELIIRRLLKKYEEETNAIKTMDEEVARMIDKYIYK